jgi:hypothetical protein
VSARDELARMVRESMAKMIVWHPGSVVPPDGAITVACSGRRSVVARYRDGKWLTEKGKPLGFQPEYWMGFKDGPA